MRLSNSWIVRFADLDKGDPAAVTPCSYDFTMVRDEPTSMVIGMATKKITVTLPEEQVAEIQALTNAGVAASVSGFVQHAVAVALDDVSGWAAMLELALDESGGPLTDDERTWADSILDPDAA